MATKQFSFAAKEFFKPKDSFGGSLLKNSHAKTSRPIESKLPIHIVLRAKKSVMRLPKTIAIVDNNVDRICKKHGVTLYKYANVGNHLHLLIKLPRRQRWAPFIRELTGRVAQLTKNALGLDEAFWSQRPYTRIVRGWQKAFQIAKDYVELNWLESQGFISRKETKTLKSLREIWDG
jgi:REP element-mobilizing transposase RayT